VSEGRHRAGRWLPWALLVAVLAVYTLIQMRGFTPAAR
jgi:hypothetical protein